MPILFAVVGLVLIVSGVRGTLTSPANPNLVSLIHDDLTGTPNFIEWAVAIVIIGAIGYIPQLRTASRLFMGLVVIGLLFANKGFFAQFAQQTSGDQSGAQQSTTETQSNLTLPSVIQSFIK
jgi:hypothetical protein